MNAYVDESIRVVLANADPGRDRDCHSLTFDIFAYIYLDRLRETILQFIENSAAIDVYPRRDVSIAGLLDLSIYRDATFPYIIRVTRNVRLGKVYLGVDKLEVVACDFCDDS